MNISYMHDLSLSGPSYLEGEKAIFISVARWIVYNKDITYVLRKLEFYFDFKKKKVFMMEKAI